MNRKTKRILRPQKVNSGFFITGNKKKTSNVQPAPKHWIDRWTFGLALAGFLIGIINTGFQVSKIIAEQPNMNIYQPSYIPAVLYPAQEGEYHYSHRWPNHILLECRLDNTSDRPITILEYTITNGDGVATSTPYRMDKLPSKFRISDDNKEIYMNGDQIPDQTFLPPGGSVKGVVYFPFADTPRSTSNVAALTIKTTRGEFRKNIIIIQGQPDIPGSVP